MLRGGTDLGGDKETREAKLKKYETKTIEEEEIRKKRSSGKNSPTFL